MDDRTVEERGHPSPEASRSLLESAGYVLDAALGRWQHRALGRALDARIADKLTPEHLTMWIADGRRRRP